MNVVTSLNPTEPTRDTTEASSGGRQSVLHVGGFTPFSSTDWPGQLVAVVFVQGCPWRCHYCHNPSLQPRSGCGDGRAWHEVMDHLRQRQGLLDGVVFSGGEPTLDAALPEAMAEVRAMGFGVGLHTAGLYPDRLATCLALVDWVALDIKTNFEDYKSVTSVPRSGDPARRSLELVLGGGRPHEIRTTWHPEWISEHSLLRLGRHLREQGVQHWILQTCRPTPETRSLHGTVEVTVPRALLAELRRGNWSVSVR